AGSWFWQVASLDQPSDTVRMSATVAESRFPRLNRLRGERLGRRKCQVEDSGGDQKNARFHSRILQARPVGVPMRSLTHGSNLGSSTTGGRRAYRLYRCWIQHMEIRNLGESINAL